MKMTHIFFFYIINLVFLAQSYYYFIISKGRNNFTNSVIFTILNLAHYLTPNWVIINMSKNRVICDDHNYFMYFSIPCLVKYSITSLGDFNTSFLFIDDFRNSSHTITRSASTRKVRQSLTMT